MYAGGMLMGIMDSIMSKAAGSANTIYYAIIGLIILGALGALVLFIILMKSYNKRVTIQKKVSMGYIYQEDKCREFTDSENHKWWIRWKERDKLLRLMPQPPSDCCVPDNKGREHATCKLVDGNYTWVRIKDDVGAIPQDIYKDIPEKLKDITDIQKKTFEEVRLKNEKLEEWKKLNGYEVVFHPLTSNHRAIYVNAIRRAYERKQQGWQSQLPMIAGLGAVVLIFIALLVFYGNIAKPAMEMADKAVAFQNAQNEGLQIMKDIKTDVQVLKEDIATKKSSGG